MSSIRFSITDNPDRFPLYDLLNADHKHPHYHLIDMPFRLTSTWQDFGWDLGVWEKDCKILAWAVFQPPWQNLDYAILPGERGAYLEQEVFSWGVKQMVDYARANRGGFYSTVELSSDTPNIQQTVAHLESFGFVPLEYFSLRFEVDLQLTYPRPQLPNGYRIRPFQGQSEVAAWVSLVAAVFGDNWITKKWRIRTLEQPAYRPEIDLVAVNSENHLVGFCTSWLWQNVGQIEPLGVHPDYQGIGLGTALELTAIEAMQQQGARLLYVDHGNDNQKAISLSQKLGFRQIDNAIKFSITI